MICGWGPTSVGVSMIVKASVGTAAETLPFTRATKRRAGSSGSRPTARTTAGHRHERHAPQHPRDGSLIGIFGHVHDPEQRHALSFGERLERRQDSANIRVFPASPPWRRSRRTGDRSR